MVERVNSRVLGDAKNSFAFGVNAPLHSVRGVRPEPSTKNIHGDDNDTQNDHRRTRAPPHRGAAPGPFWWTPGPEVEKHLGFGEHGVIPAAAFAAKPFSVEASVFIKSSPNFHPAVFQPWNPTAKNHGSKTVSCYSMDKMLDPPTQIF